MATGDGNYVKISDIRDQGVTQEQCEDADVAAAILDAEATIESKTGRWFYKRTGITLTLDGGNHYIQLLVVLVQTTDTLSIPIPIINLTAVSIWGAPWDLGNFIVMNRIGPPKDDRWNPRILSKYWQWPQEGVQNIALTGDFGFTEADGTTTPLRIKQVAKKLAIRNLPIKKMTGPEGQEREMERNQGYINAEVTPGYQYKMRADWNLDIPNYTGDPEIDQVIEQYRWKKFVVAV